MANATPHRSRGRRTSSMTDDEPLRRNIAAVAEVERAAERGRTWTDRVIDWVAGFIGRPAFLIVQPIWVIAWIVWNEHGRHPFDHFPFPLLGLVVSLEAILITTCVLISQRRMTAADNRREHLNLQVNLLAEAEMTKALNMLDRISEHLGLPELAADPETQRLSAKTDILEVARHLDEELTREATSHKEAGPSGPARRPARSTRGA
jgi:uncharacterized membrane protein